MTNELQIENLIKSENKIYIYIIVVIVIAIIGYFVYKKLTEKFSIPI